jgi:hypothetical protein
MYEILESPKSPNRFNYFLFAANSDIRSYNSLTTLINKGCTINNKILFNYEKLKPNEYDSQKQPTKEYLEYQKFSQLEPTCIHKCNDADDDVKYINKLELSNDSIIGIDITGFTIPDIFRICYILKELKNVERFHAFYTEPQHYVFDPTFDKYTHLDGSKQYKPVEEYYVTGTGPELLVFFLGFDSGVSNYVYEKAQPQDTVIINGFPSYVPKLKDISLLNNYPLLTNNIEKDQRFFVKANNPFSAYNVLCDIQSKYPNSLMNICVLGTKPMALGACIFALNNKKNVKVTYPYPKKYKSNTVSNITKCWHYLVEF